MIVFLFFCWLGLVCQSTPGSTVVLVLDRDDLSIFIVGHDVTDAQEAIPT